MTLKPYEQSLVRAMYLREGSLRRTAKELGYSPNTVKKYVQGYYSVDEQNIVRELRTDDERLIGTYVGLWMGDGTQYIDDGNYTIKICLDARNKSLIAFVKWVFVELFGTNVCELRNPGTNSYYVKTYSKFIYEFADVYCAFSAHKTSSVQLKNQIRDYSRAFLEGCLLGLMLSDGHLGKKAQFNVTSEGLAENMRAILTQFGYRPQKYVQQRNNPNWNDLIHTVLCVSESESLERELNCAIQKLSFNATFYGLKYAFEDDPARI